MKKFNFVALLSLLSFSALAADVTTFTCEMTQFPKQKFAFKIKNLGKPSMELLNVNGADDYSDVFVTNSRNDYVRRTVDTLNGQGGDLRDLGDRLYFFGDAVGIDFVYFELFKNSGYTRGFVRVQFDVKRGYSPAFCVLTK